MMSHRQWNFPITINRAVISNAISPLPFSDSVRWKQKTKNNHNIFLKLAKENDGFYVFPPSVFETIRWLLSLRGAKLEQTVFPLSGLRHFQDILWKKKHYEGKKYPSNARWKCEQEKQNIKNGVVMLLETKSSLTPAVTPCHHYPVSMNMGS